MFQRIRDDYCFWGFLIDYYGYNTHRMNSVILGTGAYAPDRVLTNADLERMVETSDSLDRQKEQVSGSGVLSQSGQKAPDLAIEAANRAACCQSFSF